MQGLMQEYPLCVTGILDHAARWHGEQEVVSVSVEGALERSTYRQVSERARLGALALKRLGIRCGRSGLGLQGPAARAPHAAPYPPCLACARPGDRVATLAFNTVRHLEAW